MGTVVADGVTLHYNRTGSGPEIVLIHGLAANRAYWFLRIAPELAKRHTVTAYDLRGHGYSDTPPTGYTSGDMARDLRVLLDRLGVRRAHLVGHSFGGVIALHFASRHPDRVATLTLADAGVPAFESGRALQDWAQQAQGPWQLRNARPGEHQRFVPFAHGGRAGAALHELVSSTSAVRDTRAVAGLTGARIARMRRPVLALYGANSQCGASLDALRRTLPDCTVRTIDGAGHFYPLTRPLAFVRHVVAFIQERDG